MTDSHKSPHQWSLSPTRFRVPLLILSLLALSSCLAKRPIASYPELTMAVASGDLPRSVAVLPFVNRTESVGLDGLVRSSFYSHLSVRPYRDVELHTVDRRLRGLLARDDRELSQIPAEQLGRLLGCDAVVFGETTEFRRVFAGIYSQMAVGASIDIWDTRSGRKIWSDRHAVRYHEGGVPLSLVDIPLISVRSGMNLRGTVKIRAVDELARYLARRVPAPRQIPYEEKRTPVYAYELQVGAFLGEQRALDLLRALRERGYPGFLRRVRNDAGLWHRVLLGPYEDHEEAIRVQKEIQAELGTEPIMAQVLSKADPPVRPRR